MKKFVEAHCPLDDNIAFWVDVKIMPQYKEWESLEYTKELKSKMFEDDSVTETAPHGTRRPTTMEQRREYAAKAKQHLRWIEPHTMSVRTTRNGGVIHKGNTYKWLPEWKKTDRRRIRHEGKSLARDYGDPSREMPDFYKDIDPNGIWDNESQTFISQEEIEEREFASHVRTREKELGVIPHRWYYVVTSSIYASDGAIIGGEPHVVLAYYEGDNEWTDELVSLFGITKAKPFIMPTVEEILSA